MKPSSRILFQSLVMPFYREKAGTFLFLFTIFFCAVGQLDAAGLLDFHYSLATGMLSSGSSLALVFSAWLLYAWTCSMFISVQLKKTEYNFLYIFNSLSKATRLRLFFAVEVWLLMPILLYTLFVVGVAIRDHFYLPVIIVVLYLAMLCLSMALWHVHLVRNLHNNTITSARKSMQGSSIATFYPLLLVNFVANKQKNIWAGLKLYTCGLLYLLARNNTVSDYDTGIIYIFFSFGILGNGILVHRIRSFEETHFSFHRGLPVPLSKRLLHYFILYFILLLPEFITAVLLTPVHLHYTDAINFSLCAYSLLLTINSISFLKDFTMKEYLKILVLIFFAQYFILMMAGFVFVSLLFFIVSVVFFITGYYRFEKSVP